MNKIINKFLLLGDKCMPEMHLRQPGLTYSVFGTFTKNKELKNLKKQEIQDIVIKTNQIKLVLNMIWLMEVLKIQTEQLAAADKVLRDKASNIAKNLKYDGYQRGLGLMVHKPFDKETSGGTIINEKISNKELTEELHKPIIRKFEKRKV